MQLLETTLATSQLRGGYTSYMVLSWGMTLKRSSAWSSTEAECAALTVIGKENVWQRQMYADATGLKDLLPTPIHGDNTASIALISAG